MSTYSALYLAFFGLAAVAPVFVVGYMVLAFFPQARRFSVRGFIWSAIAGALVCGSAYAVVGFIYEGRAEISPHLGVAVFAFGFSVGTALYGVWVLLRRVLSNNLMQPTGQERPAAD
jgi:peptidoglycan/LPS O-acetylase OafA/YrhL